MGEYEALRLLFHTAGASSLNLQYCRLQLCNKPKTLLCVQGLLAEADTIVNDGQWEQLNTLLQRVQNQPNFLKGNLRDAMAGACHSTGGLGCWNAMLLQACEVEPANLSC